MPERSRRRVLQALAAATVVPASGCASVANSVSSSGSGTATDPSATDSPTAESTPTATDAESTATPEGTATDDGWSVDEVTIEPPSNPLSSVPVADDGTEYARMGAADATTVTLFGNWKCPYTRAFVLEQLPGIVDDFVRPGDVAIRFRAIVYRSGEPFLGPDAPRAGRAGLGVWESDPGAFWRYFMYVFANQPPESRRWAKASLLGRFAEAADVANPNLIEEAATGETYADRLSATVDSADRHGVWSVPRVLYDGDVTAPTVEPERTRRQLEQARDD